MRQCKTGYAGHSGQRRKGGWKQGPRLQVRMSDLQVVEEEQFIFGRETLLDNSEAMGHREDVANRSLYEALYLPYLTSH